METITLTFTIVDAQEIASSARSMIKKIDWILENKPPVKKEQANLLDERAKQLSQIATQIETALHQRALTNATAK